MAFRTNRLKLFPCLCAVETMRLRIRRSVLYYTEPGNYIPLDRGALAMSDPKVLELSEAMVGQHDLYARQVPRTGDKDEQY